MVGVIPPCDFSVLKIPRLQAKEWTFASHASSSVQLVWSAEQMHKDLEVWQEKYKVVYKQVKLGL